MPAGASHEHDEEKPGGEVPQTAQTGLSAPFPIVGIGASAGGLEALEQFFSGVPAQSGMAFVVVQHLDPSRKGMLPELLQRVTPMPVKAAGNRVAVRPNCVYVIPPNKDLSLRNGVLHLSEPAATHGLRLPIDFFFHTLAADCHERAVGVILSGMGSDGTLGLHAIKAQGGLALVQEPTSAKFDSMPRSAIDAGLADFVAPARDLPGLVAGDVSHTSHMAHSPPLTETTGRVSAFRQICAILLARTNHDFSLYKKSTVYRRIERRMSIHQLAHIGDYAAYLNENFQEVDLLFKELLIGVTNFFRDPAAWDFLQREVLPALIRSCPPGQSLRAWVAGCSSGEEAYTLAIAFREAVDQIKMQAQVSLQIFATDLDPDAVEKARRGYYAATIAADVSRERLRRFFIEDGDGYRIGKEIREMVVFAPQNVIMDPPFTRLDILTCRNLMIYLGPELQKKLLPLFHYSLKPGGVLFLGSAESIGNFNYLFTPLESKAHIYRREPVSLTALEVEFPARNFQSPMTPFDTTPPPSSLPNLQSLADQLLLQTFAPAAVLVNGTGDILFINGRTGKYLEPAAGKANWNIHAMAREGLRQELVVALPKAVRSQETVVIRNLTVGGNESGHQIDLTVFPIQEPLALRGMVMIVFTDVPPPRELPRRRGSRTASNARIQELEQSLLQASAEIQAIREEMQSSHEELKSANEELQSTNEELQSTNEELTTSKEEMQSLNEELQTVNSELQSKVEELSATNNDMKNLLNSTDIATVFLDNQLHVRRFTNQATRIFKLIPGDVGRPLSDIVSELNYPDLERDSQEVLRTLVFSEREITSHDSHWYIVKIMPYRTLENVIDGVVITFIDISEAKRLEAELRAARGTGSEGNLPPAIG